MLKLTNNIQWVLKWIKFEQPNRNLISSAKVYGESYSEGGQCKILKFFDSTDREEVYVQTKFMVLEQYVIV